MEPTYPEEPINPAPESIGMRKREHFALEILSSMIRCEYTARLFDMNPDWNMEARAVDHADRLIDALNGIR